VPVGRVISEREDAVARKSGTDKKRAGRGAGGDVYRKRGVAVTVAVFALMGAVYLATLFLLFPNLPIIAHKAEDIPGYDTNYPPFRVDEYNYHTIAENILSGDVYAEGSLERSYTIGFPVVALPFIALFGRIGGYVANAVIMWTCLVVFYLTARRYASRAKSLVLTAVLAFATLNWFYAASCYTEPLSQLLLVLAFYFLTVDDNAPRRRTALAAAGCLAALNLFVRPHYILVAAPFFLYLWVRAADGKPRFDRSAFLFAGGAAAVIVLWAVRNALVFGGPFTFEYSRLVDSYIPGAVSSYIKGNVFLGMHRLLFDQYHGLFTITPILLVFPAGLRSMWLAGRRAESLVIFATVLVMILFAAASAYPFTEFGLGSRHMLPVLPLMLLPAVFFLDGRMFSRSVIIVLALYSFYHAGIGWFTGGEPGMGFFLGILNESQSRAVILARKGLLPEKRFDSEKELIDAYLAALKKADLMDLLQTMDPLVIEKIRGNERTFMLYLRSQPDPAEFILSADPERGIVIRSFSISKGPLDQPAPGAAPSDSTARVR